MIKVYDCQTGEHVDSFKLPTRDQIREGHPNKITMILQLNTKGYCVAEQLREIRKIGLNTWVERQGAIIGRIVRRADQQKQLQADLEQQFKRIAEEKESGN